MEYKKDACLMIDPRTGVEQPKEPEEIVKAFVKQAKKPYSLLCALDELTYKDWRKWEPVRQDLWDMLEELDKLGY
ncbi:hypothetical protein [Ligilactobacillus ruminis]|uniref:Phage-associated protein n=2 Tax=Ligilactobacillus ruminis TaxID=1623 RepID=A0A837ITW8_9LACO|nr:hypothetical protein [Ligilactobacillus ruminis]KLA46996.1 phage-associated protein [Ligilactobacillus ruminis]KRM82823.1 hypothetical protein FC25_GL000407 [Ligilactobacillus ruminis DSM 20403 = NBRC 102161]SFG41409.1 hypothetical protein SAMN02910432_01268 [Ligilactobacillus ruminis DSM 20403 = NBRC 102161]